MAPYNMPQDAVWFITGCSSGIGLHLCQHLAANTSCRVVATARNPDSLSAIPDGPNVLKITLDVTSESSIQAALTQTLKTWSRIDIVVNNAGYGMHADTETASLTKARNLMDTNFWAAVRITQLALPILRDENPKSGQRGGAILQITSLGGRHGFPGGAFYHASKFALEGFSEALYKELPDEWNIHVSCIEPGGVKTNYASTATANRDAQTAKHPAYTDPNMPANVLRTYQTSPEATKNWAEPEKVVQVMYELVKEGGEIPVRLPLGSDSWGMQVQGAKTALELLEKVKSVSLSTSGEEQLESIGFLKA